MEALDLALCLWRGSILEAHSIESQGCSQLRERVRSVGVEEAVVVHIQSQRQPVLQEGTREEVVVAQEHFSLIKARASDQAGTVVEDLDEMPFRFETRHKGMRRGVHLPQFANALPLPATHAGTLVPAQDALGLSAAIGQRPSPHA